MRLIWLDQDDSEADEGAVTPTVPPKIWFLFRTPTCSYRNNHLCTNSKADSVQLTQTPRKKPDPPSPTDQELKCELDRVCWRYQFEFDKYIFHFLPLYPGFRDKTMHMFITHLTTSYHKFTIIFVASCFEYFVPNRDQVPSCPICELHADRVLSQNRLVTAMLRPCRCKSWQNVDANHDDRLEFLAMVTKLAALPSSPLPFYFWFYLPSSSVFFRFLPFSSVFFRCS